MAGNAMHVTVCGVLWMYVLTQVPMDSHLAKILWQRFKRMANKNKRDAKRRRIT